MSLGLHTITAVYAGDANFIGSSSSPFPQTVNMGFVALRVDEDDLPPPGEVSFVGHFTQHPVDLTGTLTFTDGGTSLGSVSRRTHGRTNPYHP